MTSFWHRTVLSLLLLRRLPTSPPEARPCSHLLRPHALGLRPGQWRWTGWGPVDRAGARTSPAAPERLPEERPGAGQRQETRRAAIAREVGGGRDVALTPSHTHTHLLQLLHPSGPHSSSFSFVVLSTQRLHASHPWRWTMWCQDLRRKKEKKTCLKHYVGKPLYWHFHALTLSQYGGKNELPFHWELGISTVFWMVKKIDSLYLTET